MIELKDKYIGTLIGCALGDSLGMPVEPWPKARIQKHFGRITTLMDGAFLQDKDGKAITEDEFGKVRCYGKGLKKGEYTDDTILTLALAESIAAKRGVDLDDIAKKQLYEYTSRIQPDGKVTGGFGGTTRQAFKRLMEGISPLESGVIGGPGNAPAMKMSPFGLYMDAVGFRHGLECAKLVGKITHLDPRSIVSGVVQAYAVYQALQDVSRDEFVSSTLKVCSAWEKPVPSNYPLASKGSLTSRLEWISENKDVEDETAHQHLGSNSVVLSSYPFALFMFQKYWNNPIEGLIETVNYGGDCDTTGAMYGALCGAKNGMIYPQEWMDVLNGKKRLIKATEGIYDLKRDP